uniref:Uncharacterized protein n=1 Tax=Tortanus dextrilobatus TaxID=207953 RepID=A0A0U2LGT2_9MAXI|nr:hypothetical protein [Tortanus dextrilobatus]
MAISAMANPGKNGPGRKEVNRKESEVNNEPDSENLW